MLLKNLAVIVLLLLHYNTLYGQRADLKICVEPEVNLNNLVFHYLDGIDIHLITDSMKNGELVIQKPFYGLYGIIQISQQNSGDSFTFHVSDKSAVINISAKNKDDLTGITCSPNENVINFWDEYSNSILKEINERLFLEHEKLENLWVNHGNELTKNDSIAYVHTNLIKRSINKLKPILENYSEYYFSFYYFKTQIETALIFIKGDPDFYHEQLDFLLTTFPSKFLETMECKTFVKILERQTQPIKINMAAPNISVKTINGNTIKISDFRGKYILLDFWATWCAPCIEQIPVLKNMRVAFSTDQLEIISVSIDKDSSAFTHFINKEQMNWKHVLEIRKQLSSEFTVDVVPTIIIIDPEGKIVYRKVGGSINVNTLKDLIVSKAN